MTLATAGIIFSFFLPIYRGHWVRGGNGFGLSLLSLISVRLRIFSDQLQQLPQGLCLSLHAISIRQFKGIFAMREFGLRIGAINARLSFIPLVRMSAAQRLRPLAAQR